MREDIEKYLRTVSQSTAKTIAERIGMPQHDVALELNRMTRDGVIEREKRKGHGNEYAYWLSQGDAVPTGVREQAAAAIQSASAPRATVLEQPTDEQQSEQRRGALEYMSDRVDELFAILGLPPTMTEAIAAARDMVGIAKRTATERDQLLTEVAALIETCSGMQSVNAQLRSNNAALEARLDELTLGKPGEKAPMFVTVGRYAKPQRHASIESAQRRASGLVRTEKESEVLVCEPIGRMVRGSEWRKR